VFVPRRKLRLFVGGCADKQNTMRGLWQFQWFSGCQFSDPDGSPISGPVL